MDKEKYLFNSHSTDVQTISNKYNNYDIKNKNLLKEKFYKNSILNFHISDQHKMEIKEEKNCIKYEILPILMQIRLISPLILK